MKSEKYDKDILNLSINLKARELSEKHIRERRELEEQLAGEGKSRFGSNVRRFQDLYESQLRETMDARLNCILDAINEGEVIDQNTENELLRYLLPYADNELSGIKHMVEARLAREGLPANNRQSTLTGINILFNKVKTDYKGKFRLELKKRNKIDNQKDQKPLFLDNYIDLNRIEELRIIESKKFDLTKLIRLCEELNSAYQNNSLYSIAMITRAILDHIPPIFNQKAFIGVANNYSGASSFKRSMWNLQNSLRNIADSHLHIPIRKKEALPTLNQVNFKADIDLLLSEIIRILK